MIIGAILTMVASFEPRRTHLSMYELERRKKEGNTPAADELRRRILLDDILSLRHILEVLLLVLLTVTGGPMSYTDWVYLLSTLMKLCPPPKLILVDQNEKSKSRRHRQISETNQSIAQVTTAAIFFG